MALSSGTVYALDLGGRSRTYTQFRETAAGNRYIPLSEYLDLSIDDRSGSGISFYFGGWGNADLADESFGKRYNSDLQYAYLDYTDRSATFNAKLGRFYVFEGVAAEQVDGLFLKEYLLGRIGVSVYGGIPVETDFDKRNGDLIYGGRLSDGIPGVYTIGVSYLKEENDDLDFREETGTDLWIRMGKYAEAGGKSVYNVDTSGWQEHDYFLSLALGKNVFLKPRVSWINYEHYFTAATTSAFTFSPVTIDPDEELLTAGGEAEFIITDNVSFTGDYRRYSYALAGDADYYGGKVTYLSVPGSFDQKRKWSSGIAYHRMNGENDSLRYNEYRFFIGRRFGPADIALDLYDVNFDLERNGVSHAYTASLALGYDVTRALRIGADVEYGENPDYDKEVKGMIKIMYNINTGS